MRLILELPHDLEAELAAEAARLNLPFTEYVLRLLAAGRGAGPQPRSGSELLAYWQGAGLVGTRSDITDPAAHVRKLRQQAEKRGRP